MPSRGNTHIKQQQTRHLRVRLPPQQTRIDFAFIPAHPLFFFSADGHELAVCESFTIKRDGTRAQPPAASSYNAGPLRASHPMLTAQPAARPRLPQQSSRHCASPRACDCSSFSDAPERRAAFGARTVPFDGDAVQRYTTEQDFRTPTTVVCVGNRHAPHLDRQRPLAAATTDSLERYRFAFSECFAPASACYCGTTPLLLFLTASDYPTQRTLRHSLAATTQASNRAPTPSPCGRGGPGAPRPRTQPVGATAFHTQKTAPTTWRPPGEACG